MVTQYAPDVQAEIDKQLREAKVAAMQGPGIEFSDNAPIADAALDNDANIVGSMRQESDPSSRDKVTIYSVETGMPSQVLVYMLAKKLSPDKHTGKVMWSMTPTGNYVQGSMLCLLHPDQPRRAQLDEIGLQGKVCTKSNIPSAFEVRQHMTHKHQAEWAVMEEARLEAERQEERDFRRMQMAQWESMNAPVKRGRASKAAPEDDPLDLEL